MNNYSRYILHNKSALVGMVLASFYFGFIFPCLINK
ncbi:hypothetical protein NNJEOMEG_03874 [Fundidesulfovibrio magnetotacticus]|uniref:Uncharacterized protein n=1 Tax=Fundidesulfovibrio magnetotacticus TaxID=2730080 RepID=A0A6V8LYX8_9BACT|nr:hypothetical protein NNJEOMEG_03874 [Fundidesulfovibrio magnetotacticus]